MRRVYNNSDYIIINNTVRQQLLSIQTLEDADDRDVLLDRAPWWAAVFSKFSALYRLETRKRQENLSVKRRARAKWMRVVREGPESPSIRPKGGTLTTAAAMEASQEDTISGIVLNHGYMLILQNTAKFGLRHPLLLPVRNPQMRKRPAIASVCPRTQALPPRRRILLKARRCLQLAKRKATPSLTCSVQS
jgi:hypothetical protein